MTDVPDYRELYYRWEHERWEAGSVDFSEDRRQWAETFSPQLRRSWLWALSPFYVGAEQATTTLVPFVDAAPTEEQQVFLTTQLADEARHWVFFDRFYSEVAAEPGAEIPSGVGAWPAYPSEGLRALLLEMLPAASERIREDLDDLDAFVYGVVLYHLVIQGALQLTGQRFLLDFVTSNDLLPGFRDGFTAVARDRSRHVAFGVHLLSERVTSDGHYAGVITHALSELLPLALMAFDPPNGDRTYCDALGYGPEDLTSLAVGSLKERLSAIGVEMPA